MSKHIALVGDSIFDNKTYTSGEPDVIAHLRGLLPAGWGASLHAVDGATTGNLPEQVQDVPEHTSHLVVSIGGNNALMNIDELDLPVQSTAEALVLFGERLKEFEASYRTAIDAVLALGKDTTICTIYNGNFEEDTDRLTRIALMRYNDAILRMAFARRVQVIDLRFVCSETSDYANEIEPSGSGGRKIAQAIARACGALEGGAASRVFVE